MSCRLKCATGGGTTVSTAPNTTSTRNHATTTSPGSKHGSARCSPEAAIPEADQDVLIARVHEISGHRQINAYDEIAVVLAGLRERGLALGICSNWDWDLVEAIEAAGLTDTTDFVVSSAWVGARKPHPRIYSHILDEMGVEPEAVLFVGDTWACDVEGPTALGMQAVYVRRPHFGVDTTAPEQLPKSDRIHPVADLTSLPRLCK